MMMITKNVHYTVFQLSFQLSYPHLIFDFLTGTVVVVLVAMFVIWATLKSMYTCLLTLNLTFSISHSSGNELTNASSTVVRSEGDLLDAPVGRFAAVTTQSADTVLTSTLAGRRVTGRAD